ncbi:MAG: archaellin/type IV pilin N-terminal domain-containing protein [Methanosarcina sp.]
MINKFVKNEKGFTGLEAAIVLVAFVVVAAVFSYVMLGAGFFTTQKSQEVVHTGVTQASSSVELSGDVIAVGDLTTDPDELGTINLCLQLTSGGSSVDMNKTLIVFSSPTVAPTELKFNVAAPGTAVDGTNFGVVERYNDNNDYILDKLEKFDVQIDVGDANIVANSEFQLEIKPPQGATYTIHRQAPAAISDIITLV